MPYGRYDPHGTVHKIKNRIRLNYFCAFISFFCGIKSIVIMLTPWTEVEIPLLLIEVYVVNHELQRFLLQCLTDIHFTVAFSYLYWGYLNSNPRKMRCLNMFFISDIKQLCKQYGLKRKQAQEFVEKAKLYKKLMYAIMVSFSITFSLFLLRCWLLAYFEIEFWLFIGLSTPMALISFFSFYCLIMYVLSVYLLNLLTMDWLILRLSTISEKITRQFKTKEAFAKSGNRDSSRIVLLKGRPDRMRLMQSINSVVVQFREANSIFDYLIGINYFNSLFGSFCFPAFLFLKFPVYFNLSIISLYVLSLAFFCFFLTGYNDRFVGKVSLVT